MNKHQAKALANLRRAERELGTANARRLMAEHMALFHNDEGWGEYEMNVNKWTRKYEAARQGVARREWELREAFRD